MGNRGRKPVVSALIDPLLIEGGRTVAQIADLVIERLKDQTTRDGSPFTRKKVINNIRQRMFILPRYGYNHVKDSNRTVRFEKRVEETTTKVAPDTVIRKSNKDITR